MVMRGIRVGSGLVALMLVLTGCYKADYDITVEEDGSATLNYIAALNYEILAAAATNEDLELDVPDSREEFCNDTYESALDSDDSGSDEIKRYDDGTFCGAELLYSTGPGDDPGTELKSGLISESGNNVELSDWTLVRTDTGWMFELPFPQDLLTDLEIEDDTDQVSATLLASSIDINYSVTLPGQADAHNALRTTDEAGSTTFVWAIDVADPPTQLFANTLTTEAGSTAVDSTTSTTSAGSATTAAEADSSESTSTSIENSGEGDENGGDGDEDGIDEGEDEATSATTDGGSDGLPLVPIGLGGAGLAMLAGGGLFLASRPGKNKPASQTAGVSNQQGAATPMIFSQGSSGGQPNGQMGAYTPAQQHLANQPTQIQGQPTQQQGQGQAGAWTPVAGSSQSNPASGPPNQAAPVRTFTEPEWDAARACWVVRDNSGVSYRHDSAINQWVPFT